MSFFLVKIYVSYMGEKVPLGYGENNGEKFLSFPKVALPQLI